MDHLCKSLEFTSVKALVQISEDDYQGDRRKGSIRSPQRGHPLVTPPKRSVAASPVPSLQPTLTPRAVTDRERFKSASKERPLQSRVASTTSTPRYVCSYLDPFRPILSSLAASGCKCVFVGGGGFKATNKVVPCSSPLCINRVSLKYQWKSEGDLRSKKTRKSGVLGKPQQQGWPVTESWMSPSVKAREFLPRPLPRLPIKLQRRVCKMVGSKSTLTLRPKIPLEEGMLRVSVKIPPKSRLLPGV